MLAAPRGLSQLHHVLHRLPTPRHPPEALISLTKSGALLPRRRVSVLPYATSIQLPKNCGRRGGLRSRQVHTRIRLKPNPHAQDARNCMRNAAVGRSLYSSVPGQVEITGFEPVTPCVQSRCSTGLSYIPVVCSRTRGTRLDRPGRSNPFAGPALLVGPGGLEPPTFRLSAGCSAN